jgi:uncharacterized delta-60 repeat protein
MTRYLFILIVLSVFLVYTGCSKVDAPVASDISPTINIAESDGGPGSLGIMGAYELNLDTDRMVADLTPMRSSAIGESYIVSGATFFTISPCPDCLKLKGIQLDPPYVKVIFSISHPFEKGDTGKPPTAMNRLDLDIFDLALIVAPTDQTPVNYALTGASIYSDICGNADGYTRELEKAIGKTAACPYFLVVDNSETGTSTNNRFEMGTKNLEFGAWFKGGNFNLYLTMGYGASAKKPQRLHPTYYLPEFNRKAVWKVVVEQPASWSDSDSTTENNVIVKVYDWQIGATVDPTLNDPTDIYASSNVAGVGVEIPGMFDELKTVTTPTGSHAGTPTDPLIYTIPIANENLLSEGTYTGLVKVLDTRTPPQNPTTGQIDSLVDAQYDGNYTILEYKSMPEFAMYQLFTSNVISGSNNPPVWDTTIGIQSATPGDTTITVTFGTATDPDGDNPVTYVLYYADETATANNNPFTTPNTVVPDITSPYTLIGLTNYHTYWLGVRAKDSLGLSETNTVKISATPESTPSGNLIWAKRAGGANHAQGYAITTLPDNSVVATGRFDAGADFGQGEPNETTLTSAGNHDIFIARYNPDGTLAWAKSAGGTENDYGYGITALSDNSVVATGNFLGTATFGQDEPNQTILTSAGDEDIFIARYNSNGTLAWAKCAGGAGDDRGRAITTLSDNSVVATGYFQSVVIFGADEPNQTTLTSAGGWEFFIARYNSNGTLAWAKRAGGAGDDLGYGITALSDNSVVATGYFRATAIFGADEPNQTNLTSLGDYDVFTARFNPGDGTLVWAKRAGGLSSKTEGSGITTLTDNSVVVTGPFLGTATFGQDEPNETILTSAGSDDIFIARYNYNGSLIWAKRAGGANYDRGIAITKLSENSVVATGYFQGETTLGQGEPNQTTLISYDGSFDIFIARYNPDGTLAWAKRAGAEGEDIGLGITTLSDNSVVAIGYFQGVVTFGAGEPNETDLSCAGFWNMFIARFAP